MRIYYNEKHFTQEWSCVNQRGYASKGHPAIPMEVMVLRVDLADRLGKPHRVYLILLWLNPGPSTKNNFELRPSYGLFSCGFRAATVRAVLAVIWE